MFRRGSLSGKTGRNGTIGGRLAGQQCYVPQESFMGKWRGRAPLEIGRRDSNAICHYLHKHEKMTKALTTKHDKKTTTNDKHISYRSMFNNDNLLWQNVLSILPRIVCRFACRPAFWRIFCRVQMLVNLLSTVLRSRFFCTFFVCCNSVDKQKSGNLHCHRVSAA